MVGRFVALVLAIPGPTPAMAEVALDLPLGARAVAAEVEDPGRYALPVGRFGLDEEPVVELEGRVTARSWEVPADRADTLAILRALQTQLRDLGFEIMFDCSTAACGGFDFRFGTRVLPPPAMAVNLDDFRFTAARADDPLRHVGLLVSRTEAAGYIQLIEVEPGRAGAMPLAPAPAAAAGERADLAAVLDRDGRLVLERIDFEPGSDRLTGDAEASLGPLAELLLAEPDLRLLLVGHSDDRGALAANVALSRQRAEAVRRVLIDRHGIAANRLVAEGAGFLAPRAGNGTEAGRALNRRVEAVPLR